MFGTPSEHWAERLQTQPQLSSSSSVKAEEFPARVLQQIVSHHLRCLCKYPSTAVRKHSSLSAHPHPPPHLWMRPFLSLILIYFLWTCFFVVFFLRWEKEEAPLYKNYRKHWEWATVFFAADDRTKLVILSLNKYWILVVIWDMQHSMSGLSVRECESYHNLSTTHLTATSTNTDCAWFNIYINKPLGCYRLVYKQSGANSR